MALISPAEVSVEVDRTLPVMLANEGRLFQVFQNLIENATPGLHGQHTIRRPRNRLGNHQAYRRTLRRMYVGTEIAPYGCPYESD